MTPSPWCRTIHDAVPFDDKNSFARAIVPTDDARPFLPDSRPPVRCARFASLAPEHGGDNRANGGDHAVYRAAGHLRSQDGAGRSERRLARSTDREADKSDGEVRFSARPSWSELGLDSRPVIYIRRLCLWNTEVRTRGTSSSAVPSSRPHATS